MKKEEFLALNPGTRVMYRPDHTDIALRNLTGTIQDVSSEADGPFVTVKTDLKQDHPAGHNGVLFTYWPSTGKLCFLVCN